MAAESLLAEFSRAGVVKLDGAFSAADAEVMQAVVWREMARRYEIDRDDPTTWNRHEPTGLVSSKKSRAFTPILSDALAGALDELFGVDAWTRPTKFGNVLVTMPNAAEYRVPHAIWHSDFPPTLPRDRLAVVKVWALFDDVAPGGAGTPQLAGSHRAFANYLDASAETDYKRAKFGFLKSHPWLKELSTDRAESNRNAKLMDAPTDVDGVPLQVVECHGAAGDVFITHPWVFHSIAVNATARARMMRSLAVWAIAPDGNGSRTA